MGNRLVLTIPAHALLPPGFAIAPGPVPVAPTDTVAIMGHTIGRTVSVEVLPGGGACRVVVDPCDTSCVRLMAAGFSPFILCNN